MSPDFDSPEFRPRPFGAPTALGIASAAAGTYLALTACLALTFDFFAIAANIYVPPLLLFLVSASVALSQSRATGLIAAGAIPPVTILALYLATFPPYVKQSIGLSHFEGHAIIVLTPGLVALLLASRLSRRR